MNQKTYEAIIFYAIFIFIAVVIAFLMGPTTPSEREYNNSYEYLEQEMQDNNYR